MSAEPADLLRSIARVSARELSLIAAGRGEGGSMGDGAGKERALLDVVRVLEAVGAPYALIGGVAVGLHAGVPRATLDIDFAVHTAHRTSRVLEALLAAGFESRGEHPHSVNFRHSSGEPVQFTFDEAFDAMIERAETFDLEGASIRIVRKEDLIAMKRRAAGDPARRRSKALRDRADVELLGGDVPDPDEGW